MTEVDVLLIIYLLCLICGLIYTLVTLFFGHVTDWLGQVHVHLPVLQPILLVSGITAFGGAGYLLTRFTSLASGVVLVLAFACGLVLAVAAYFLWVEPMNRAENSIGYSMSQLTGKIGEVVTTIPSQGLGEVLVSMVSGTTNHMAASLDRELIREGVRVVVVEVRDHVLYVTPFPDNEEKERMGQTC